MKIQALVIFGSLQHPFRGERIKHHSTKSDEPSRSNLTTKATDGPRSQHDVLVKVENEVSI